MDRNDLIEAGARALNRRFLADDPKWSVRVVLDAVEPLIRLDMREKVNAEWQVIFDKEIGDLRDAVEALPDLGHQIGAIVGYRIEGEWVMRADVLDLIDGDK